MAVLPRASATALTISEFDGMLGQRVSACNLRRLRFMDAYGVVGTACALRVAVNQDPTRLYSSRQTRRLLSI